MDGGGPGAPAAHADPIEKRYDGGHGPFSWQEFVHFYGEATAAERWNLGASNVEADGGVGRASRYWHVGEIEHADLQERRSQRTPQCHSNW